MLLSSFPGEGDFRKSPDACGPKRVFSGRRREGGRGEEGRKGRPHARRRCHRCLAKKQVSESGECLSVGRPPPVNINLLDPELDAVNRGLSPAARPCLGPRGISPPFCAAPGLRGPAWQPSPPTGRPAPNPTAIGRRQTCPLPPDWWAARSIIGSYCCELKGDFIIFKTHPCVPLCQLLKVRS